MNTTALMHEKVVLFADRKHLPGKPSYNCLVNWSTKGRISPVTGELVTLEWCFIGARRVTSAEAYERFTRKLNGHTEAKAKAK